MNRRLDKKLCKDFPHLFRDRFKGPKETALCWGIDVGDGWYQLLHDTAEKLEPLIEVHIKKNPKHKDWAPTTVQIKQKFGRLFWYVTSGTKRMHSILDKAEEKSVTICEQCGKPGKLRGEFFLYTACWKHVEPEDQDNLEYLENKYEEKQTKQLNKN